MTPPETIPEALDRAARAWPNDVAVVDGARHTTFAELHAAARAVAHQLVDWGIQRGDRVALWAPNSDRWVTTALGAYLAGAVLVPVNTRFKGAEAAHMLRTSRARALCTVDEFLGVRYPDLLADQAGLEGLERIVLIDGGSAASPTWLTNAEVTSTTGAHGSELEARAKALGPRSPSEIIFTSGTTGTPKGAVLTHGAGTRAYTEWAELVGLGHGDRYLAVQPFFHTAGLKSGLLACLLVGATLVPQPVFDVEAALACVAAERITVLPGPPTIFQALLARTAPPPGGDDAADGPDAGAATRAAPRLGSLRVAVVGAADVPMALVEELREALDGGSVVTGYGLTEATGVVAMCRYDDPPEVVAHSSGRPLPGLEVRLVDEDGRPVAPGEVGELHVRGYTTMLGYLDDPAATAEAIDAEGWLRTGDLVRQDAAGNLTIVGRSKDLFIVGGFNAYPAEIEAAIARHPDVASVAVVGVPDERLGEVGAAFVVPRAGVTIDGDELIAWSRERLANYKVPRQVLTLAELPLNASGKVVKSQLLAMLDA